MRICVIGPTYPYRGGIAHYTTLLVRHLREAGHWTRFYSFTRQYPRWLFPGKTDKDTSAAPLKVDCEYILDPMNPITWWRRYRKVRADAPDVLLLQWWVPYWTPCLTTISRWIKRNTMPPQYALANELEQEHAYTQHVADLVARLEMVSLDSPASVRALCDWGITRVYIGQGQVGLGASQLLSPQEVASSDAFQLAYHQDRVYIFALKPQECEVGK